MEHWLPGFRGNQVQSNLTSSRKSATEMAGTVLRLLVLLLGFSHLLCLNAVPVTRTRNLVREYHGHVISEDAHLVKMEKNWEVKTIIRRLNVDLNDYPGSGANNRHTPKRGGGCVEC